MRPDNGVDIAMRPSLSFSKFCPSAKRKHRSNHRASASNQSSLSIFNSSETHESAKAEADFKSMPIPSFKSSLDREKDDQLEQMERSLFAELQPTKKSKVSAVKSVAAVKRPPIPTFSLSNDSGSDDDDDDLLLAPVFPSNKCSMDQGKPRPMTTIESVDKVAKNDNSYESKVQAKSCEEETGKNCKNGRTSSGDNPPEQRLNHSGDNSDSGISVIREDEKCSTKRKAETIVPVSDSTASTKTKQPRHQPSLDETFINAIDDIFQGSDQATLTVKQFTLALEKHFQVKFTPKTKSFVKKRLSDLVNGVIVPSASAEKHTFHKADLPLVDISNDDMNPKGPQPIDTQKTPKAIDNNPKTKPVFSKDVSNQKHGGNSSTNELKNQERPERKDFPLEKPKDVPVAVQMNESNLNKTPIPPPQHYPLTKPENIKTGRVEVHNVDSDEFQVVPAPSIGASENADAVASNNPSTVVGNKKRQVKRKRPSARSKKAEIKCDEYPTSAKCDAGPVDSNESTVTKPLPKKATRKRARAGTCSLCKTCPCTATSAAEKRLSSGSLELPTLNRSDAAIENTLVRRLQKLEKTTEKFEEQTEIVRRELKKHRRNVWRREEANKPDCKILAKDRFLPDGVELDSQLGILNNPTKISESIMKRVQVAAFGRECIPNGQPTLTQLFGGCGGEEESSKSNEQKGSLETVVEEDELYEEDDSDSDESDYLGDVSSVDVVVHRVTWTRGEKVRESNSPETTFKGSWETFLTSAVGKDTEQDYECAFNRLFAMESPEKATKEDGALGIDELLGLFSQSSPTKGATSTPKEKRSPVDFSALTQRGRGLAETIQDQIISNSDKLSILESTCPQWRENVAFAMKQKDDGDVEVALENVRKSKQRLEKMKESFLGAWQQQQTVLDVYELSLNESLKRLSSSSTSSDETTETETEVSPDDDASSVRYRKAAVK